MSYSFWDDYKTKLPKDLGDYHDSLVAHEIPESAHAALIVSFQEFFFARSLELIRKAGHPGGHPRKYRYSTMGEFVKSGGLSERSKNCLSFAMGSDWHADYREETPFSVFASQSLESPAYLLRIKNLGSVSVREIQERIRASEVAI